MSEGRKIEIVISAQDDYSAMLKKFNTALGDVEGMQTRLDTSTGKISREYEKLTSASEYAAGGLKKVRNMFEGMVTGGAIGLVAGFVSTATEALLEHYKINSQERIDTISNAVSGQAQAWKLLPDPIKGVTGATVDLYNAQLKYLQLVKQDEGEAIRTQIENLEQMRRTSEINMQAFPSRAAYFKNEIADFDIKLAEAKVNYEKWLSLMGQTPATIEGVKAALAPVKDTLKDLKVSDVTGPLEAFVLGDLDMMISDATPKYELAGMTFGKTMSQAMSAAIIEEDPFSSAGTLNFSIGAIGDNKDTVEADLEWQKDFYNRLISTKATAAAELAELENPYGYQGGNELADAYSAAYGDKYEADMQALQDYNTRKLQLMVDAGATQTEVQAEFERLQTQTTKAEYQLRLSAASSFAGGMSNFFQNLYVAAGSKNEELFELSKAFAIANAVMNTAEAATKALNAPPGPPWSFAYVAAAIASGAAQIATISSTEPGSATSVTTSSGDVISSYSGGSIDSYPTLTDYTSSGTPEKAPVSITLNVSALNADTVDWDKIVEDNIVPAIEGISERGYDLNITTRQK